MAHIFGVSELTSALKNVLEAEFPFVWVRGQVGNLTRASSGHIYFNLKDEDCILNVVWFASVQNRGRTEGVDPLTGEVIESCDLELKAGLEILCAGHINVYAPRGSYQLVAELVQEKGKGLLQLQFEALQAKLAGEGLFDVQRKRRLPPNPRRVALITAPGGAAVHDFLRLAHARGQQGQVRIYPSLVQGDQAPAQLMAALQMAITDNWAEAIVFVRGGGSLEDLWAFNDENLVRAVADSSLPVLSGIGHEVDTSLLDLAADMRAATPTHAAQILWPERQALEQRLDELEMHLIRAWQEKERLIKNRLDTLIQALLWLSPLNGLQRNQEQVQSAQQNLKRAMSLFLQKKDTELVVTEKALQALDFYKQLQRGFCFLQDEQGQSITSLQQISVDQQIKINFGNGHAKAKILRVINE